MALSNYWSPAAHAKNDDRTQSPIETTKHIREQAELYKDFGKTGLPPELTTRAREMVSSLQRDLLVLDDQESREKDTHNVRQRLTEQLQRIKNFSASPEVGHYIQEKRRLG